MFPAITGSGESVFDTDRSADVFTVAVALAVLFAGVGSDVGELADAVLVIVAPLATFALTFTTTVKAAPAPAGSELMPQLTVPPDPTAGLVHVKGEPVFWTSETNVVPAGSVSVRVAFWASDGPPLLRLTA